MRALQVNLKQEVTRNDAVAIMDWMENYEVTQYLNEVADVSTQIKRAIEQVNMVIMTHLFNRNGSFYMIYTKENHPVGFIKLIHNMNEAEMVIVIGDKMKWGQGIGTQAIRQGLNQAFFEWRKHKVIAKIDERNTRSIHAFIKSGFQFVGKKNNCNIYNITMEDYIKRSL
jgi:RimJ/RimL family protein N-acetyltransferase